MANKRQTPQEASRNIRSLPTLLAEAMVNEVPLAVLEAEADLKVRIFRDGRSADGGNIGRYSTEPIYVSTSIGVQPYTKLSGKGKGKNGRSSKFKNGKQRKSRYFAGGYSELRQFLGRGNAKVDLKVTGSLEGSIRTGTKKQEATIAFTNPEQADIGRSHETKYGKEIFGLSQSESDRVLKRLDRAVEAVLEKQA